MEQQTVYDKKLWRAAVAGDIPAFSELFKIYFPKLYIFALKYTKDSCLAEDVVQQVFLKCWEKKTNLAQVEHIDAYLYRCIRNEVMDVMRRQILQSKYQQHMVRDRERQDTETLPQAEIQMRRKQEEILSAAINHLSPQQKKVYKLSKEHGWSYAKIAREMEVSTHTVKWHAAAAFQALSHFLKRHENELFVFVALISLFF